MLHAIIIECPIGILGQFYGVFSAIMKFQSIVILFGH